MTGGCGFEYDEKAAARILKVAPRTLRAWRQAGKIPYYRTPGGRVRYSAEQLLELQLACRVAGGSPAAA